MKNVYSFEQLIEMAKVEEGLERKDIYYYKKKKKKSLEESDFMLISDVAYLEEDEIVLIDGEEVPKIVIDKGMSYYYDPNQFEDVISFQYEKDHRSTIDDYIKALDHYHEKDDFLDE